MLLFVLLTLPRLLTHELWRDEAWLWLVVGESPTVLDLAEPLARSGQGWLFPLICFVVHQVSSSPLALQLVHLALAGAAAFGFLRWAPLGRLTRTLAVCGYFPFYEYAVISRHYAAGALLLWWFCAAYRGRRSPWLLGGCLALLCQTTVYGVILALALAIGSAAGLASEKEEARKLRLRPALLAGLVLLAFGLSLGVAQLVPKAGTSFAPEWWFEWDPARAVEVATVPFRAFVPLPPPEVQFWNRNVLDGAPVAEAVLGISILLLAGLFLWPCRVGFWTFLLGSGGLLAFSYVKYLGVGRHHGHLWLLFLAAFWLSGARQVESRGWRRWSLPWLLGLHAVAGVFASSVDLLHPFSNGPAVADWIRRDGLGAWPLLAHREPPAAAVALPLGRPLYAPSRRVFTTHPDWGPNQHELARPELRCRAHELARRSGSDVILVLNWQAPKWPELVPLGSRRGAIVPSEDFFLYRLEYTRLAATVATVRCPE